MNIKELEMTTTYTARVPVLEAYLLGRPDNYCIPVINLQSENKRRRKKKKEKKKRLKLPRGVSELSPFAKVYYRKQQTWLHKSKDWTRNDLKISV